MLEVCDVDIEDLSLAAESLPWTRNEERYHTILAHTWPNKFQEAVRGICEQLSPHYPDRTRGFGSVVRLVPGQTIGYHTDQVEQANSRIVVPIVTNSGAILTIEDEEYHLEVGKAYEIDPFVLHKVENRGQTDRIHLIFNMID